MTTQPTWLADYETLQRAGIVRLPGHTQLEICGKDRAAFLHNFCTQDIKSLKPGEGTEAFITNGQGKILGHGFVFCYDDKLLFDTTPNHAAVLVKHLDRYVIREDVMFADRSDERALFALAGDHVGSIDLGALPSDLLAHSIRHFGEIEAEIRRTPWATFPIWEISCSLGDAKNGAAWFAEKRITQLFTDAFEAARIEARFPFYGIDITDKNLPQEVDRNSQAISFKKGCYLGQETVARIDAMGHVNRLLRLVKFESEAVPPPGAELRAGEKSVGEVTSSTWSPKYGSPIALAYLRREHAPAGIKLESAVGSATVL